MNKTCLFPILSIVLSLSGCEQNNPEVLQGLQQPVEVIRDLWGINHIYAENEHDLFFTQGYCAARDRLFQFELWRRQATGTVAEILGERELKRDIGTRLFLFRHNIEEEMNHYHPRGAEIITAFVEGVNVYIEESLQHPENLPLEFQLLGITPQPWTPEVVISRHQGLLGNVSEELNTGRAVALLGEDKVLDLSDFHPGTPDLTLDEAIDKDLLFGDMLELYTAFRQPVHFLSEDLQTGRATANIEVSSPILAENFTKELEVVGSNNWVLRGELTESGYPLLANDPHRALATPSLRYWAHLVAPGWNVIGGGEPEIPGISIGHNEYGAWGLTVFETDGEDLYFYETNPENPLQYRHEGTWKTMEVITDTIRVKGRAPEIVELKYTIHGPVIYEAKEKNAAIALRCAWMEIGGSPYLASLRMDQAQTWEEFRDACAYSHIPGENMVWADKEGNIGWQAVGIAPIRPHWSGLVPVPGDGQYEWQGYLPIKEKPHTYNPESGYKATANENQIPEGYPHRNAMSYTWSSPYRAMRINEVLKKEAPFSIEKMKTLQTDYLAIPALELVPLLENVVFEEGKYEKARKALLSWDHVMDKESVPAGVYRAWESQLYDSTEELFFPEEAREYLYLSITKMIRWLQNPEEREEFGINPISGRNAFLADNLKKAIEALEQKLGPEMDHWQYGQQNYHHVVFHHPLSNAVNDSLKNILQVGPLPRGGYGYTVGATGMRDNQTSGATFRLIVDTGGWDKAVGMNAPGQSGNPASPYYKNLFTDWAEDRFFPVYYSREKVEEVAEERIIW